MEPFWTRGPVPIARLAEHAVASPIVESTRAALPANHASSPTPDSGAHVLWRARRGMGATTAAHALMSAHDGPSVLLDGRGMADMRQPAVVRAVMQGLGARGAPPSPDWSAFTRGLAGKKPPLVIIDGPEGGTDWDGLLASPAAVVVIEDGAATGFPAATRTFEIAPLDAEQVSAFLTRRLATVDLSMTPEALSEAIQAMDGSPVAMQRIGQAMWTLASRRRARRVTADDVADATVEAAYALPTEWAIRLAGLSGTRRRLLLAMARAPDDPPARWGQRCGITPNAVPVHMARLVTDQLVYKEGRGAYRISSPLVAAHLRLAHGRPWYGHRPNKARPARPAKEAVGRRFSR